MAIDIEPTVKAVADIVNTLKNFADEINRINMKIIETKDVSRTAEVLNSVTACFNSLRLDLLVNRPLREYEKLTK